MLLGGKQMNSAGDGGSMKQPSEGQANQKIKCVACQRQVAYGADVWSVQQGVFGPRGFVHVEDRQLFCSHQCVSDYYGEPDPVGERVP